MKHKKLVKQGQCSDTQKPGKQVFRIHWGKEK